MSIEVKVYEKGRRKAKVRSCTISDDFVVEFYFNAGGWFRNTDCYGTDGTGVKLYSTRKNAVRAARRYINKED